MMLQLSHGIAGLGTWCDNALVPAPRPAWLAAPPCDLLLIRDCTLVGHEAKPMAAFKPRSRRSRNAPGTCRSTRLCPDQCGRDALNSRCSMLRQLGSHIDNNLHSTARAAGKEQRRAAVASVVALATWHFCRCGLRLRLGCKNCRRNRSSMCRSLQAVGIAMQRRPFARQSQPRQGRNLEIHLADIQANKLFLIAKPAQTWPYPRSLSGSARRMNSKVPLEERISPSQRECPRSWET